MKGYWDKLNKAFYYGGLEPEEYEECKEEFWRLDTKYLRFIAVLLILFMTICFVGSYKIGVYSLNQKLYGSMIVVSVLVLLSTFPPFFANKGRILFPLYFLMSALFLFGILIGLSQPDQISATFLIFIMVGPLLIYDKPFRPCFVVSIFSIIFVITSLSFKEVAVQETDFINGISFAIVSCIINTINLCSRMQRVWFSKNMERLASIDPMTKLKNRARFHFNERYYSKIGNETLSCIFVDVNGLHELNNTLGHDAGDEMLIYVADCMSKEFGKEDTYRLGGDEFATIVWDKSEEELWKRAEHFVEKVEEKGYSIALGIATVSAQNVNMPELLKLADNNMYTDKKQYYDNNSKNRRQKHR
ncbi:MAG: GGDEF domain-containing protein [Lachnospiraceae bacterium]|nr:GGDEF domain-containing protein [Lachnospiraceae bacterium]